MRRSARRPAHKPSRSRDALKHSDRPATPLRVPHFSLRLLLGLRSISSVPKGRALEQCEASDPSRGAIVAVSPRSSVDRPAVLPIRCCSQLVVQRSDQGDCSGSAIAIACLKQRGASRMSLANARSAFVRTRAISAARSPTAKGSKGSLAVIRGRDSDGFALPHRRKAHPLKHPGLLLRRQGVPVGFRLPLSGSPLMPGKPRVFPGARQAHSQAALG